MHFSFGTQRCDQQSTFDIGKGEGNKRITAAIKQLFRVYKIACKYHNGPIYQLESQLKVQFFTGLEQFNRCHDSRNKNHLTKHQYRQSQFDRKPEEPEELYQDKISRLIYKRTRQKKLSLLSKPLIRRDPFKSKCKTQNQQKSLPSSALQFKEQIQKDDVQKEYSKRNLEQNNDFNVHSQYETFKQSLQAQNKRKSIRYTQQKYHQYKSPKITEPARPLSRSKPGKQHLNRKKNILNEREIYSLLRRTNNQNRNRIQQISKERGTKRSIDQIANNKNTSVKIDRKKRQGDDKEFIFRLK